jgi:hypothetical protein
MDHIAIEREVNTYLEALSDLFFTQADRHPVHARITYRHTLRALYETDALRVELGGRSVLRPCMPIEAPRSRA